jgi:hypothetical protein
MNFDIQFSFNVSIRSERDYLSNDNGTLSCIVIVRCFADVNSFEIQEIHWQDMKAKMEKTQCTRYCENIDLVQVIYT